MSTQIPDTESGDGPHILSVRDGVVDFSLRHQGISDYAYMPRADFIAAVEAELGVKILDAADLLPVDVDANGVASVPLGHTARYAFLDATEDDLLAEARAFLALAAHRRAHPQPDAAKVEALTAIIDNLGAGWTDLSESDLARRLLATGRIDVKDVTS